MRRRVARVWVRRLCGSRERPNCMSTTKDRRSCSDVPRNPFAEYQLGSCDTATRKFKHARPSIRMIWPPPRLCEVRSMSETGQGNTQTIRDAINLAANDETLTKERLELAHFSSKTFLSVVTELHVLGHLIGSHRIRRGSPFRVGR